MCKDNLFNKYSSQILSNVEILTIMSYIDVLFDWDIIKSAIKLRKIILYIDQWSSDQVIKILSILETILRNRSNQGNNNVVEIERLPRALDFFTRLNSSEYIKISAFRSFRTCKLMKEIDQFGVE